MFEPEALTSEEINLCKKTISSNTFYMLVGDALVKGQALSVVRMGDGEFQLINAINDRIRQLGPEAELGLVDSHSPEWLARLGLTGITRLELTNRLLIAAERCTYFAPSISGIQLPNYNLYPIFSARDHYVDNFFVNAWTEEMKIQLFKAAGHVLFIHRNLASADALQIRAKYGLNVKVTFLKLDSWEQADDVIAKAHTISAPLVLFSAGPGSKYIGPRIAHTGPEPKVTLDIGNAADNWLLYSLKDAAQGRR